MMELIERLASCLGRNFSISDMEGSGRPAGARAQCHAEQVEHRVLLRGALRW